MVNVETIVRTSNVISIKGMLSSGTSNKKIKKVPVVFSENDTHIINCSATQYSQYKTGATLDSWGQGINTIDRQIDIVAPFNNGAKYIYILSTGFFSHEWGINYTIGPLAFFKNRNTYEAASQTPFVIKTHGVDYNVANNNGFDNKIVECYYPLDTVISKGGIFAVASYCGTSGPYTADRSSPYTYVNTIIDKPIVYFIYEE